MPPKGPGVPERLWQIGRDSPQCIISHDDLLETAEVERQAAIDAINLLLAKNLFLLLHDDHKKKTSYRALSREEAKIKAELSREEHVIYSAISAGGNKGVWRKTLISSSGLHNVVAEKALKKLEGRKLIKTVANVMRPTRKTYMLYDLTPSAELSGGPWYTDNELDTAFIEVCASAILQTIHKSSFPKTHKDGSVSLYSTGDTKHYPSISTLTSWFNNSGIAETKLAEEHVRELLDMLVYSGEIEALPSMRSHAASGSGSGSTSSTDSDSDSETIDEDEGDRESRTSSSKKRKSSNRKTDSSSRPKKKSRLDRDDGSESDTSRKSGSSRGSSGKKRGRRAKSRSDSDSDSDRDSKRSRSRSSRRRSSDDDSDSDSGGSDSDDDRGKKRKKRSSSTHSKKKRKKSMKRSHSGSDDEANMDMSFADVGLLSLADPTRAAASTTRGGAKGSGLLDPPPRNMTLSQLSGSQVVYRAIQHSQPERAPVSVLGGWSQAPCGHCPRFDFCHDDGPINPVKCEYFETWLEPEKEDEQEAVDGEAVGDDGDEAGSERDVEMA